jgi:hypothetical protein
MNVDLAFTPQAHWTHIASSGAANSQFPALSLSVPVKLYRRLLYVYLTTLSGGATWAANGSIKFLLNGRTQAEQTYRWSSPQVGEVLRFATGQTEDSIRWTIAGTSIDVAPHEFIVACDTIRFDFVDNFTSGGASPMYVFGCKSESHW